MKKALLITAFLLTFALGAFLFCLTPAQKADAATYGDLTYTVTDGEVTITGYKSSATSVTIPDAIDGYPVTSIGAYAFRNCSSLKSVSIPGNVRSIGTGAFDKCYDISEVHITDYLSWLDIRFNGSASNPLFHAREGNLYLNGNLVTEVVFPENKNIGNFVFANCTSLTTIIIPDGVKNIGIQSFFGCTSLSSVVIPDSVTTIGGDAFRRCTGLTSINIPNNTKSIGSFAFAECTNLKSVKIGDSVTSIGEGAFSGCSSLTRVDITDIAAWCNISFKSYASNPMYHAKNLYLNGTLVTDLKLPDDGSITSIGNYAFERCRSLESISIPDSVTSIGERAFHYCTSLTSVSIGNGVGSIGQQAFSDCTSLESISIGNGVTRISTYEVFYNCTNLKEVHITDVSAWCNISFWDMYSNPLYYAKNLYLNGILVTELVIPDGVTSIGKYAFCNCTSIASLNIGKDVTSIGASAFSGCTNLKSINIPDSVTSFGASAFSRSSESLESIYVGDNRINNCLIDKKTQTLILGCKNSVIPSDGSVTSIGESAFYNSMVLEEISIPDCVTSIGSYAFYNCQNLTSVSVGKGVASIGNYAFYNCPKIKIIYFNSINMSDLPWDNNHVFSYAGKSSDGIKVTIGKDVERIPAYLFRPYYLNSSDSPKITEVTFEEGSKCTSIGDSAFDECSSLTSINIPNSVTSIGNYAFDECSSLNSITIPEDVTTIGYYAFYGCRSLESINIPNSVTSIGDRVFYGCSSLTSVTIGNSVTSIGNYVFCNCSSLTSINIPYSVTSIGNGAFYKCTSLKTVYYCGTEEQWNNISIGSSNTPLTSATRSYHKYEWTITEPTCTQYGEENGVCEFCGETQSEIIPTIGHGWSEWHVFFEPSDEKDGYRVRACEHCFETEGDIIVYGDGDVDGDGVLTNSDITLVIRAMSGWDSDMTMEIADANYDGKITNRDIIALIRRIACAE